MGSNIGDNGRALRVPVSVQVEYRSGERYQFTVGQGTDLSTSGLFVHTDEPKQVGSMLYLRMALPGGSKELAEGFGRVARVGLDTGGHRGMAIQFIHLDERSNGMLEKAVASGLVGVPRERLG